jgi:Glycosyl transferases group 1
MTLTLEPEARPIPPTRPLPGVYGWTHGAGGVHWHRLAEPLRGAGMHYVATGLGIALDDDTLSQYDTVLCHMLHDPVNSQAWERLARIGHHRLVIDVDDAMWEPDWTPFDKHYGPDAIARLFRNVSLAHVVTTTTPALALRLAQYNRNVHVLPNTVPAWLLDRPRPETRIIGYQGSPHHVTDWTPDISHALIQFMGAHPTWRAHFWGPKELCGWPERVGFTPWQARVSAYYGSMNAEIGLGPLADTPFNRAKSSLRFIEYAAMGIVPVLSDVGEYRAWVDDGRTGVLIPAGAPGTAWAGALADLASDPLARARISTEARDLAARWTTEARSAAWVHAWNSA